MSDDSASLSDERQERAALLVAQGTQLAADIAKEVGITARTLQRWRNDDAFARRVDDICGQFAAQIVAGSIADRQSRVAALDDRWQRMKQVISERATDATLQDIPGGKTGLIVHQQKPVPGGGVIDEYAVDTGLLRELRAHEQQAAQETGQWTEKRQETSEQNVTVKHEHTFDFDTFGRLFADTIAGAGRGVAGSDGP